MRNPSEPASRPAHAIPAANETVRWRIIPVESWGPARECSGTRGHVELSVQQIVTASAEPVQIELWREGSGWTLFGTMNLRTHAHKQSAHQPSCPVTLHLAEPYVAASLPGTRHGHVLLVANTPHGQFVRRTRQPYRYVLVRASRGPDDKPVCTWHRTRAAALKAAQGLPPTVKILGVYPVIVVPPSLRQETRTNPDTSGFSETEQSDEQRADD